MLGMILGIRFHQFIVSMDSVSYCFLGSVEKCHLSVLGFILSLLAPSLSVVLAVLAVLAPLCRVENLRPEP